MYFPNPKEKKNKRQTDTNEVINTFTTAYVGIFHIVVFVRLRVFFEIYICKYA